MAILLCLTASTLQSQQGEGFVVHQRAGIALVKPQPWSKDTEATVLEFQAFINRTADGTPGAGYYEFRTRNASRRQIPVARIVKLVVYPDAQHIKEIVSPQHRQAIVSRIEEIEAVMARFPASRSYLDPPIRRLNEEIAQYDSGKVKVEGAWVPRQSFEKDKATRLADLLRADIARAKPPSSLDLDGDPRFLGLKELAETNSDAKRLAAEISAQLAERVRAEKRGDLVERLERPETSLDEAQAVVAELKALRPGEDPRSARCVTVWDSGIAAVRAASQEAEKISKSLESELAGFNEDGAPAQLPTNLEERIVATRDRIARFLSSGPPPQLASAIRQAATICTEGANFIKLKAAFEERRYLEAKDTLDELARHANLFGPETQRVVSGLRRQSVGKIEQFTRLRDEAKLLADSGKKPEALAKFEAAYSVMPDSDVAQQIAQLRRDVLASAPHAE